MLYMIHCTDKPDHLQVRLENRDAHLAYISGFGGQLFAAGPLLSEDEQMQGSVLIMDFESLAEAEAFCANDPYQQAGLFAHVQIARWKKVLPAKA